MKSRERVLAAIAHKEPDYVPLDLGATPSSDISAIAYNNLKKHLGLTGGHTRIYDVVQQVVQPEDEILDRFGVDVLDIGRVFNEGKQTFDISTDRKSLMRSPEAPIRGEQMMKLALEMLLLDMIRSEHPADRRPKISSSVKRRADSDLVARVIRCMEEHLHESMSFAELCQYSAQSATNLKTIFKSVTGQGVMEYYRGMKITEAKTMMREGEGNITQIADKLGYSSIHYFSRHFKQATGMTPREYTQSVQIK